MQYPYQLVLTDLSVDEIEIMMILREMVCNNSRDRSEFTVYDRLFAMMLLNEDLVELLDMLKADMDQGEKSVAMMTVIASAAQFKSSVEQLINVIHMPDLPRPVKLAAFRLAEMKLRQRSSSVHTGASPDSPSWLNLDWEK